MAKLSGYSSRKSGHGQLREAENTIGGTWRKYPKRHGPLDLDAGLELEESIHLNKATVTGEPTSGTEETLWMPDPNRIGVTHDVHVDFALRE